MFLKKRVKKANEVIYYTDIYLKNLLNILPLDKNILINF